MPKYSKKNSSLLGLTALLAIVSVALFLAALFTSNWLVYKINGSVVSHVSLQELCLVGTACLSQKQQCSIFADGVACKVLKAGAANLAMVVIGAAGVGLGAIIYIALFLKDKRGGKFMRFLSPLLVLVGLVAGAIGLIQWALAAKNFIDGTPITPFNFSTGFGLDVGACAAALFAVIVSLV